MAQSVIPQNIPLEMRRVGHWVDWQYELTEKGRSKLAQNLLPDSKDWAKVPYQPGGSKAKSNDPSTWHPFERCLAAYQTDGGFDGVMFALSSADPYFAIDLDNCRLDDINEPWANEIIGRFGSYTEASPSSNGIRIFGKGELPAKGHNSDGVEVYDRLRFITATGHAINDSPILECQEQLDAFVQERWPQDFAIPAPAIPPSVNGHSVAREDDVIIDLAMTAANGQKFKTLWEGDTTGYPSPSEADMGLVNILVFWTQDPAQIDQLFRLSGLMRGKWDETHGDQTYGEQTIAKVLSTKTDFYKGKYEPAAAPTVIITAATQKSFRPAVIAKAIKDAGCHFAMGGGQLHIYDGGTYIPAKEPLDSLLIQMFGDDWQENHAKAVFAFLERDSQRLWEKPLASRINMRNGIFNFDTGQLEPHTPEYLSTVQLNVYHDPDADCPRIRKFISDIVPDDAQATIFEMVGYLFTPDNSAQKAFLLVGDGANGKGTFLRLITAMLGSRNVSHIGLQNLTNDRFAKAGLYGRLANIAGDIPSDRLADTSDFKAIVGGDEIRGENKYGHAFNFHPFSRLIFSINQMFESSDTGYAFRRRWVVIPFPNNFPIKDIDAELQPPGELSGFFNQAVAAWKNAEGHFTTGASIQLETEKFHEAIDPVVTFMKEQTVDDDDGKVQKPLLYRRYKEWCEDNGRRPLASRKFNEHVHQYKGISKNGFRRVNGYDFWPGFRLVSVGHGG